MPAGQVGDLASAFALASSLGLDPVVDMPPGRAPQVRHPVTYSRSRVTRPAAPPMLGEHDHEIRAWLAEPRAGGKEP